MYFIPKIQIHTRMWIHVRCRPLFTLSSRFLILVFLECSSSSFRVRLLCHWRAAVSSKPHLIYFFVSVNVKRLIDAAFDFSLFVNSYRSIYFRLDHTLKRSAWTLNHSGRGQKDIISEKSSADNILVRLIEKSGIEGPWNSELLPSAGLFSFFQLMIFRKRNSFSWEIVLCYARYSPWAFKLEL